MDDMEAYVDDGKLTLTVYGAVRGKVVASLCHAYALTHMKLALAPVSDNAPWRIKGKTQDYFVWRKAMAAEQAELKLTLAGLMGGEPVAPGTPKWPLVGGKTWYDPELAARVSQDYARVMVRALGLAA